MVEEDRRPIGGQDGDHPDGILIATPALSDRIEIGLDDLFVVLVIDRDDERMWGSWRDLADELGHHAVVPAGESLDQRRWEPGGFGDRHRRDDRLACGAR